MRIKMVKREYKMELTKSISSTYEIVKRNK